MIYVNGDSWTSGWPDEEKYGHREFSWPHLLSEKLGEPILNDARAASSNSRIYRRTFDYIVKNKPQMAIVCWTNWARQEIGNSITGKIHQCLPEQDKNFFKEHWHPYLQYSNFLRQIISLQHLAKGVGTNLLLLDTYKNNLIRTPTAKWFDSILKLSLAFDAMDDNRIYSKFKKIIDLNNQINYNQFLSESSYDIIIAGSKLEQGHPIIDGHQLIANYIYSKIKENNHGKTI